MKNLNQKVFFAHVRDGPFPGRLTQDQVDGMTATLDMWGRYGTEDDRHLAYVLATEFHETGSRMQPVREGFASSDKEARRIVRNRRYGKPAGPYGHVYYGRGQVQLTWYENYVRMGRILGLPLAEKPDLVLQDEIGARVMIEGMTRGQSNKGDFTGKALSDYFNDTVDDPVGARRIVNGTDKAQLIAGYYSEFLAAVKAARRAEEDQNYHDPLPEASPRRAPPKTDGITWGAIAQGLGGAAGTVTALFDRINNPYALGALALVVVGLVLVLRGRLRIIREAGL